MTGVPYVTCSPLEPRRDENKTNKGTQGGNVSINVYAASHDFLMWVSNKGINYFVLFCRSEDLIEISRQVSKEIIKH